MPNEYICTVENIDAVLEEMLEDFTNETAIPGMKRGITKTVQDMVRRTKATAPVDGGKWDKFPQHREGGTFKKHIGYVTRDYGMAFQGVWRVRAPEYRLAHLLENGHVLKTFGKPTGKRTQALNFVEDARNLAEAEVRDNIIKAMERT